MKSDRDTKLWRVTGPVLVYFLTALLVRTLVYFAVSIVEIKNLNVNAAFNGVLFARNLSGTMKQFMLIADGIAKVICIIIYIIIVKKQKSLTVNKPGKQLLWPVISVIFGAAAMEMFLDILPIDGILGNYDSIVSSYVKNPIWLQLIILVIITPVMEEILFRSIVYERIKAYYDPVIAAYLSGIIYGIYHMNLVQGIYGFFMGIFLAYVYEKYGGLTAALAGHVMAGLIIVILKNSPVSMYMENHLLPAILMILSGFVIFGICIFKIHKVKKI